MYVCHKRNAALLRSLHHFTARTLLSYDQYDHLIFTVQSLCTLVTVPPNSRRSVVTVLAAILREIFVQADER
jgi:hypothetical protein